MIKTLLWLILAGFFMVTLLIYWPYLMPSERKALRLLRLCKTLELGMTKGEVTKIMGPPLQQASDQTSRKEYNYFLSPRLWSEFITVVIKEGKVVGIACGEGFEVYEPATPQTPTSTK